MRHLRSLVIVSVLVSLLVVGTTVAYADWGWWWNSKIDVEGTTVRTAWTVLGDLKGSGGYTAAITVTLPDGANASVLEQAGNESVVLAHDSKLSCTASSVDAIVTYNVTSPSGQPGQRVSVSVEAGGQVIGQERGRLGHDISLHVSIPATGASC